MLLRYFIALLLLCRLATSRDRLSFPLIGWCFQGMFSSTMKSPAHDSLSSDRSKDIQILARLDSSNVLWM